MSINALSPGCLTSMIGLPVPYHTLTSNALVQKFVKLIDPNYRSPKQKAVHWSISWVLHLLFSVRHHLGGSLPHEDSQGDHGEVNITYICLIQTQR